MADDVPAGIGDVLGAAGACPEVVSGATVWKVGHPTQKAKAALEELAASKAVANVRAMRDVLPAEDYAEMWDETRADLQAGAFKTWQKGWKRVVMGGGGEHLFLLALLREHHPKATEADALALAAEEPEQVAAALARVVPGFLSVLLDGVPIPPARRDQLKAAILEAFARRHSPSPEPNSPPSATAS